MKLLKNFFLIALVGGVGFTSCDIDQTQEGELPSVDVDVDAEAGQLPEFDVDWADIDVGTRTKTVKVPKVVVVMEEEEIEVPYVDVDMPNEGEKEEINLAVEADIRGVAHDLNIQEVYATGKRLYVISTLESTGEDLDDQTMRVSDQIVLNAPDLDVKYYIIGKRPDGDYNRKYTYVNSRADLNAKLKNGKVIWRNS